MRINLSHTVFNLLKSYKTKSIKDPKLLWIVIKVFLDGDYNFYWEVNSNDVLRFWYHIVLKLF